LLTCISYIQGRYLFLALPITSERNHQLNPFAMSTAGPAKVPFFKKGKARPTTSRQRSASPSSSRVPESTKSQVVLPSKKATSNLLSAGTKRKRIEGEDYDDDDRDGPDMKYSADASHQGAAQEILAGDEIDALMESKRRKADADKSDEEAPDDGKYHGQNAYKAHLKKNKEVPKAMRVGPQRSTNSTIRTVTIVDYQPDVCKDYKGSCVRSILN
jgi:RING finger protein 113A